MFALGLAMQGHLYANAHDILEMLAVRIAATRALLLRPYLEFEGAGSAA